MKEIPSQLHNIKKTTQNDIIISFRVDGAYANTVADLFQEPVGTEFKMNLDKVSTTMGDGDSNKSAKEKFWGKLHALLGLHAEIMGWTPEQSKDNLKNWLVYSEMIEKSTTELDVKGLAIACNQVEGWIKQAKK